MDFKRLRYFAIVAAEGSFHRASARLNIAQPALSRRIRELEEELGVQLFSRSAHGVKLLPAGKVLLVEAERLLVEVEAAKTRVQRSAIGQYGVLRIGVSTVAAESRPVIAAYAEARRQRPDVEFSLIFIESDRQVEALGRGDIDIGVLYRRPPHPPAMRYRDLREDGYVLAMASDHPLAARDTLRLADLRDAPVMFISKERWPLVYGELMAAFLKAGVVPRITLDAPTGGSSSGILVNMVAEGLAISFINSYLQEQRRIKGVKFMPVEDLHIALTLAAMWDSNRETPATQLFVDLLEQHMGPRPA